MLSSYPLRPFRLPPSSAWRQASDMIKKAIEGVGLTRNRFRKMALSTALKRVILLLLLQRHGNGKAVNPSSPLRSAQLLSRHAFLRLRYPARLLLPHNIPTSYNTIIYTQGQLVCYRLPSGAPPPPDQLINIHHVVITLTSMFCYYLCLRLSKAAAISNFLWHYVLACLR
jgi:hypothetical protein